MDLEICTDNFETLQYAASRNFKRAELCSALDLGGLSPNSGLIQSCCSIPNIEVHVILRPRSGDFNYSLQEIEEMKIDLINAKKLGAKGVVFGILKENFEIDIPKNQILIELAQKENLQCTFHRAFDFCPSYPKSLKEIIQLGFHRLLSSGQEKTALEGIECLKELLILAEGKIEIMAGSGVNASNARSLANTGLNALHFSARKPIKNQETFSMGLQYQMDKDKIDGIIKSL